MSDITLDSLKSRLKTASSILAFKKELEEKIIPEITKYNAERAGILGQIEQIFSQAEVSSYEEFVEKTEKAVDEGVSEFEKTKAIVESLRTALSEIERKKAELDAATPVIT